MPFALRTFSLWRRAAVRLGGRRLHPAAGGGLRCGALAARLRSARQRALARGGGYPSLLSSSLSAAALARGGLN